MASSDCASPPYIGKKATIAPQLSAALAARGWTPTQLVEPFIGMGGFSRTLGIPVIGNDADPAISAFHNLRQFRSELLKMGCDDFFAKYVDADGRVEPHTFAVHEAALQQFREKFINTPVSPAHLNDPASQASLLTGAICLLTKLQWSFRSAFWNHRSIDKTKKHSWSGGITKTMGDLGYNFVWNLSWEDFLKSEIVQRALRDSGTVVYMDPVYFGTNGYYYYSIKVKPFDHDALQATARALSAANIKWMMSYNDCAPAWKLYGDQPWCTVRRVCYSRGPLVTSTRKVESELLIMAVFQ